MFGLRKKNRFEIQNFLPAEVQLDIFKCLNFNQLLNIKQTNSHFKNFINEFEKQLARVLFNKLHIVIFMN